MFRLGKFGEAERHYVAALNSAKHGYACYGLACLPRAMVQDAIDTGRLRPLRYDWRPDPLRFFARYEAERGVGYVAEAAALAQDISRAEDNLS